MSALQAKTNNNNNEGGGDIAEVFWFEPKWFKKYGIKGFYVSVKEGKRNFDESLIAHLRENIRTEGYDVTQKIELSVSDDDPNLNGHCTDGTHRLVALNDNLQERIGLPNPFPITYYNVKTYADVLARQMEHDEEYLHDVHKSPKIAKEKIKTKVQELDQYLSKNLPTLPLEQYIEQADLNEKAKMEILRAKQEIDKEEKLRQHREQKSRLSPKKKPASDAEDWGMVPVEKPLNLDPEKFVGTSVITPICPFCTEQFNVHVRLGSDGKLQFHVPRGQTRFIGAQ